MLILGVFVSANALALEPPRYALPSDINGNEWFAPQLRAMLEAGYVSWHEPFRASDAATRGEFIRLLFSKNVNELEEGVRTFDDLPPEHPAYAATERAAAQGVLKGAGDCRGTHPCYVYPDSPMTRAEASAIVVRAFALERSAETLPSYSDVERDSWYESSIYAAVSHCILRGDGGGTTMRPSATMNRAEMLVIATRSMNLRQYPGCDDEKPQMSSSRPAAVLPQEILDALEAPGILWSREEGRNSMTIPVDELITEALFAFTYEAALDALTLTTPEGVALSAENASQHGIETETSDHFTAFKVTKPGVGMWIMDMETSGKSGLSPLMKSPLQLEINPADAISPRTVGTPVTVRARMSDTELVNDLNVIVRIGHSALEGNLGVQTMEKTDPQPWDPAAARGPYHETTFTPPAPGTYCFSGVAYGTTNQGNLFMRESLGWCEVVQ